MHEKQCVSLWLQTNLFQSAKYALPRRDKYRSCLALTSLYHNHILRPRSHTLHPHAHTLPNNSHGNELSFAPKWNFTCTEVTIHFRANYYARYERTPCPSPPPNPYFSSPCQTLGSPPSEGLGAFPFFLIFYFYFLYLFVFCNFITLFILYIDTMTEPFIFFNARNYIFNH